MIRKHEKFSNRSKAPSLANIPPHLRPQATRAFHTRTTTGQAADTSRYRNKRAAKRQAKAAARAAEAPGSERQNKGKGKSKAPWETGMRYASPIGASYRPHTKGTYKGKAPTKVSVELFELIVLEWIPPKFCEFYKRM